MIIYRIQEIIESTIQGEGFWAGQASSFLRLYGCPVGCWFCDTGYADPNNGRKLLEESFALEEDELVQRLSSWRVVITGGEPLLRQDLNEIINLLRRSDKMVQVETSGIGNSLDMDTHGVWVTLSPKEHLTRRKTNPDIWKRSDEVKIVVSDPSDLEFYMKKYFDQLSAKTVYLQPEYSTRNEIMPYLVDVLKGFSNWRLSSQVHKFYGLP